MRQFTINVTNEDSELLDRITIEVDDTVTKLAIRSVSIGAALRPGEEELVIGEA